jgi:phytol kinase
MDNPLVALFLPPLLIVPAMGLLSRIRSTSPLGAEMRRKSLHIGIGASALAFPYLLTHAWMVVSAFAVVIVWMFCVRRIEFLRDRFGCVLHDAGRESYGELYFAVSLALLLVMDHAAAYQYVVPVMILTVSDAVAAIVGRSLPRGQFVAGGSRKTVSGSLAFLLSAFVITWISLFLGSALPVHQVFLLAAITATATCIAEAVSGRGLDNLSVPLIAWLILTSMTHGV